MALELKMYKRRSHSGLVKRNLKIVLGALSLIFLGTFFCTQPVEATTRDNILKKAALEDIYLCYMKGAMNDTVTIEDYHNNDKTASQKSALVKVQPGYVPVLPNTFKTVTGKDGSSYSCSAALKDGYKVSGKSDIPPAKNQNDAIEKFMKNMGYTAEGGSKSCITYNYKAAYTNPDVAKAHKNVSQEARNTSLQFCAKVDKNGVMTSKVTITQGGLFYLVGSEIEDTKKKGQERTISFPKTGSSNINYTVGTTKWSTFKQAANNRMSKKGSTLKSFYGKDKYGEVHFSLNPSAVEEGKGTAKFVLTKNGKDKAAKQALKYLTNDESFVRTSLRFSNEDKAVLLQIYLEDFYNVDVNSSSCDKNDKNQKQLLENDGYVQTRIYRKDKFQTCYVKPRRHAKDKVYVWDKNDYWSNTQIGFKTVASRLKNLKIDKLTDGADAFTSDTDKEDEEDESADEKAAICWANGGPLGWVLCPVMETIGNAATKLYEQIAENYLEVEASLLTQGDDGAAYGGWKDFQTYANIIFVIFLAFIILAQLTGIGFTNYNIKKTLPRLLVAVILINLSFILCQIAVDLSNIVGKGVYEIFMNLGKGVTPDVGDEPLFNVLSNNLVNFLVTGGEALAVIGIIRKLSMNASVQWGSWLPAIGIAFVSCAIAVIFFFILLAARKAGIVIMVILSPVAIICYSLPNMKKLFDRWLKLFTGLLLVYPLCGLLVGGGDYMSKILLNLANDNDAGVTFVLVSMAVSVIPFFMLPMILKSSFSALGAIGGRLSTLGDRLGRSAAGGIRRSQLYKDAQDNLNRRQAAKLHDHYGDDLGKVKGSSRRRRVARMIAANNKMNEDDIRARNTRYVGEGDQSYKLMEAGIRQGMMDQDVRNQSALIGQGLDEEIGSKYTDIGTLGTALDKQLDILHEHPEDERAQVRARALVNNLTKMGEAGEDALNESFGAATRAGKVEGAGVKSLAAYAFDQNAATYKKGNKGFFSLLQDIQDGKASANNYQEVRDANGNGTGKYFSPKYTSSSVDGLSGKAFSETNDSVHQNAQRYMANAGADDSDAQAFKQSYIDRAEAMFDDANVMGSTKSATTAQVQNALAEAFDAKSIANTSDKLLTNTAKSIAASDGKGQMDKSQVIKIANVVAASLRDGTISHTDSNYNALRNILTAANARLGETRFDVPPERSGGGMSGDSGHISHSGIDLDTSDSHFNDVRDQFGGGRR